jgi:Spy/CpxP family protein refolding chaperone
MNRYHLFALGIMLMFALTSVAQQSTTNTGDPAEGVSASEDAGLPSVETQLKVLTDKLNLTERQQGKIKPILKQLHDATEKLAQDKSLSHEERLAKVRPQRYKTDERIRAVLADDQKRKLDEYEHGPHPEMHGNLTGATQQPQM